MPVLAGEMAVHGETLLVEDQFHPRIAERRDRAHGLGIVGEDGGRGGDDSDAHDLKLPQDPFASSEGEMPPALRSEEHTSELQSLMRISYAVFCLKKKNKKA